MFSFEKLPLSGVKNCHRENYFLSEENKEKLRLAPARSLELVPYLEVPSGTVILI